MAILLVTHDWGVVADICHRVVVMYAGQPVELADAQAMFDEPLHPYTEGLLAIQPRRRGARGAAAEPARPRARAGLVAGRLPVR